jgi:hypothetical protein
MKRDVNALVAYLAERAHRPHEWGRKGNDCMSFPAGAVKAQTGKDPTVGLKWKSQATALSLLNKLGGVEAVLDARFERVPVAHAMRGDIGIVLDRGLGFDHPVVIVGNTVCAPGERGLKHFPRSELLAAWDVTKPKKKPRE